jgi:hypothetical protein
MTTSQNRTRTLLLSAAAMLLTAGTFFVARPAPGDAATTPSTPTVNTVVLRMTGTMKLTLDKGFLKTVKQAGAKVSVKDGASLKGRTATLPIDAATTVTLDPGSADILGTGKVIIRRKDGRKIIADDIALRLRDSGADVSSTLRGRPEKQFAALTISPTTNVLQAENGYQFVDLQMLVSNDLASAARRAHMKGIKAGALLGLLNVNVRADLPGLTLPGVDIGGKDITTLLP